MSQILWNNFFSKDNDQKKVIKLLHDCYLFSNLSKKELFFIEKIIHKRHYQAHETVFSQGEVGIGLYIVKSGSVDLYSESYSHVEPYSNWNKKKSELTYFQTLKPGDFFGELALFEANERRTATVIAREETELLGFFRPDLLEVISRNPTTGSNIMLRLAEVLSRRLKESLKSIDQLKRKKSERKSNLQNNTEQEVK